MAEGLHACVPLRFYQFCHQFGHLFAVLLHQRQAVFVPSLSVCSCFAAALRMDSPSRITECTTASRAIAVKLPGVFPRPFASLSFTVPIRLHRAFTALLVETMYFRWKHPFLDHLFCSLQKKSWKNVVLEKKVPLLGLQDFQNLSNAEEIRSNGCGVEKFAVYQCFLLPP